MIKVKILEVSDQVEADNSTKLRFRKPLFIIEAPGKIKVFKSLLSKIGINNAHVESTNGRLFDLPEKEHGLDVSTLAIKKMSPLNSKKIEYLQKHIDSSSDIFIATDSDIEGEVIAKQVLNYCKLKNKVYRILLNQLTPLALINAIKSKNGLDNNKVVAGYARRNFDRIVGYGCSTNDWAGSDFKIKGVVGRIVTPIVRSLHDENYEIARLQYEDKGMSGGLIDISIPKSKSSEIKNIISEFNNLESPSVEFGYEVVTENTSKIGPAPIFLAGISESLGISVLDAAESLQELYEEGQISYPRTDSFYLSENTISEMSDLAEHFGVSGFDKEYMLNKAKALSLENPSQEAHEGIHPLSFNVSPFSSIDGLEIKEQVLLLLVRESLRSGQSKRKISVSKGSFTNSNTNERWSSFISKYDLDINISRTKTYTNKYDHSFINDSFGKFGILKEQKKSHRVYIKPKDLLVLEIMNRKQLGRPSTIPFHADKISRRFLSNDYSLTTMGVNSLQKAALTSKGLLSAENALNIEKILHEIESDGNIIEKIDRCLEIAMINKDDIKRALTLPSNNQSTVIDESLYNY